MLRALLLPLLLVAVHVVCYAEGAQHGARHLRSAKHKHHGRSSHRQLVDAKLDFSAAKSELTSVLDLIYNRYEMHDDVASAYFFTAQTISEHSWDVWKYRFAEKFVSPEAGESYVMVFGGSSVSAGHDNQFNSSFPMIVHKRLQRSFAALPSPVTLVVDNIAQGNNPCHPYDLYYGSMGNEDPDFVGWEQSFNCGRDALEFEAVSRWAGQSRNRATLYFSASGGFQPRGFAPSQFSPPYCSEEWTVDSVQAPHTPLTHWNPTHDDILAMKAKLALFDKGRASYARFAPAPFISSTAPSGYNVWEGNPQCKVVTAKGVLKQSCSAAEIGDVHNTSVRFFSSEAERFDNPGGKGAKHHPPKAMHMWRGEAIAWLHALTMMDAIYMVEADLKAGKAAADLHKEYGKARNSLQGGPPPPSNEGRGCNVAGRHCMHKPITHTDYRPHFGGEERKLSPLVVGKSQWAYDPDAVIPGRDPNTYNSRPHYHNGKGSKDGPIYLKISTGMTPFVMLCGSRSESLKHTTVTLDLHAAEDEKLDLKQYSFTNRLRTGADVPPLQVWTHRKYLMNECTELFHVPPGRHIVGIDRNTTLKATHVNSVSSVVVW